MGGVQWFRLVVFGDLLLELVPLLLELVDLLAVLLLLLK